MTIGFRDRDIGKFDKFSWRDGSESTMKWMTQEMGQEEGNGHSECTQLFQELWLWSKRGRDRAKTGVECGVRK